MTNVRVHSIRSSIEGKSSKDGEEFRARLFVQTDTFVRRELARVESSFVSLTDTSSRRIVQRATEKYPSPDIPPFVHGRTHASTASAPLPLFTPCSSLLPFLRSPSLAPYTLRIFFFSVPGTNIASMVHNRKMDVKVPAVLRQMSLRDFCPTSRHFKSNIAI